MMAETGLWRDALRGDPASITAPTESLFGNPCANE
jgi:hypothetical protein